MILVLFLYLQILPEKEILVYKTDDKGKIGKIEITSQKDSLGYHIYYVSDREIEVILDSVNLGTIYIYKTINNKLDYKFSKNKHFKVYFKRRNVTYREDGPVYDRHTLDFALRRFEYASDFKKIIRLHVPELMIINAELKVVGEEIIKGPVGDVSCWKIEMKPRIFFIRMKFYFWIEKEYPYRFVKYEDSSGKNSILLIEYTSKDPDIEEGH
jgi:hypothetical protein